MKSMKPLAYLTTDPTNAAAAKLLAANHGVDLEVIEPRDLDRLDREPKALILDWDYLPEDYRAGLLDGSGANVVAIHGYNVGDGPASFLPRRGILHTPRLDAHLFWLLIAGENAA
jgi:hypothetical protein